MDEGPVCQLQSQDLPDFNSAIDGTKLTNKVLLENIDNTDEYITTISINFLEKEFPSSIQNELTLSGLNIVGKTAESMIMKIGAAGGVTLLNTEVEKATIDK